MSAVVAPPPAGSSSLLSRYLSYPVVAVDGSTRSLKGPKDLLFLLGAFAVLVVLREVTMRLVFAPCARRWVVEANGDAQARQTAAEGKPARPSTGKELRRQQKAATRFAEQGWSALYYTIFWSFGVVRRPSPSSDPEPASSD
jgi:acyl-CoA-dependent ceramide synthase